MKAILNLFHKPYPLDLRFSKHLKEILVVSAFILVLLFAFKPFGLHSAPDQTLAWLIPGYGLVNLVGMLISYGIIYVLFSSKRDTWTLGKQYILVLTVILWIGFLNWLFSALTGITSFNLAACINFIGYTLMVGFIPTLVLSFYGYSRHLKMRLAEAESMNSELSAQGAQGEKRIKLMPESGNEFLHIDSRNFLYMQSAGNYTEVNYLNLGNKESVVLRGSLSYFTSQIPAGLKIIRVHRAFTVNLHRIQHFTGNAQGLSLVLEGASKPIPVSRVNVQAVKDGIQA